MTPARGLCQHALVMTAQAPAQRSPRGHDDDTIVLTCHAQSLTHMSRTEAAVKGRSRTPSRRRYVNGGCSLRPGGTATPSFTVAASIRGVQIIVFTCLPRAQAPVVARPHHRPRNGYRTGGLCR